MDDITQDDNKQIFDFSKVTITNRFMFPLVFGHKEIAKPFIEAALGIKVYDLRDPEPEKTVLVSSLFKSVRYDVYIQEINNGNKVIRSFDLEMQIKNTKELPKRARYYQGVHDCHDLQRGCAYSKLKDQYVMFICPDDIFKAGLAIYSFQNYAAENKNVALNDRTFKNFYIFGNYKKLDDGHPLKKYLEYFATNHPKESDEETNRIHSRVEWYQADKETQERYMTWEQELMLAAEAAAEKERELNKKALAEKDEALAKLTREIEGLKAQLAKKR